MSVFSVMEKDGYMVNRLEEAGLSPLTNKQNQERVVVAGIFAESLKQRAKFNNSVEDTMERQYSFWTDEVRPLEEWASDPELAATAYRGMAGTVERGKSTTENGETRLNDFIIQTCLINGLKNVAEFYAWIGEDE